MGEVPLSLHISAEIKQRLQEEARLQHVTAEELAVEAIEWYLESQKLERELLRRRAAEADKGEFISSEAMLHWMGECLDGEDTPPPKPDIFLKSRQPS